MSRKHFSSFIIKWTFLVITACIFAMPLVFTLLSSVKTKVEIFSNPFGLPKIVKFSNYIEAWTGAKMGKYFINSLIQASGTVIILIIFASMAAYVLSRFEFKGRKIITLIFMLGMMVPMHTILVPVSFSIGLLNLKNNVFALILIYVAFSMPFSIMVLSNFIAGIDRSLEEAALIDGANKLDIYTNIIMPLIIPAISTISIFNFLSAWNNILFPLLFINDSKLKPISLGLLNFNGERGSDHGPLMAAIVITVAVPVTIYLLFQEKVEGGLTAGAVKG